MRFPSRRRRPRAPRAKFSTLAVAILVLAACGPVSPAQRAGIDGELTLNVPGEPGFTRIRMADLGADLAKAIAKPERTVLFIYNHGTASGQIFQTCNPRARPAVTTELITNGEALVGAQAQSFNYVLYYLCSNVSGSTDLVRKRSREILDASEQFRAAGIPAGHIFLVGHSGGASAALVAAARAPDKINAVIASAPGYGYAHLGARGSAFIQIRDIKEQWEADVTGDGAVNALVLSYAKDLFSPPEDMEFMTAIDGVERVHVGTGQSSCRGGGPHAFFYSTCMAGYEARMLDYLRARLDTVARAR